MAKRGAPRNCAALDGYGCSVAVEQLLKQHRAADMTVFGTVGATGFALARRLGEIGVHFFLARDILRRSGDVIEYEIYVNGVLSPLRAGTADFAFVYANAMGNNSFTVKAVDRSGNTSQASSALTLILWPC